MEDNFKDSVVEALILASPEPLSARKIVAVMEDLNSSKIAKSVARLNTRYVDGGSAFRIRELAGGYQFHIVPEFSGYVQELFARRRKLRLTRASLETLAIVAYRQPVSKTDIEHIRGVASDGVIHNLLEKNMITIAGRAATVGKPLQYGTTDEFLKFFGLNRLEDLPKMSEIEELLSNHDSSNQPELGLEDPVMETEDEVKLNVADRTYAPTISTTTDDNTTDRETGEETRSSDAVGGEAGVIIDVDNT